MECLYSESVFSLDFHTQIRATPISVQSVSSSVFFTILKLAQRRGLDIGEIRTVLRREWPGLSEYRRRRYIQAAISYLHYKSDTDRATLQSLGTDMALVHPINPNSPFAQELREERQKGLEQGLEQGLERGLELEKLEVVAGMLAKGFDWVTIETIVHLDQAGYEALKAKHSGMTPR